MFKNQNIVIISIQPWDISLGSNCKDIAFELSKNNRVLYVNEPLNTKAKLFNKKSDYVATRFSMLDHNKDGLVSVNEKLSVFYPQVTVPSINFIPFSALFNLFNKRNNRLFASEIKRVTEKLNFKDYILFIDSSMFRAFYLKEMLDPKTMIYYMRDNLVIQPYFKKHGARLEPLLMAKADLVASNSDELAALTAKFNKNSVNIGQGSNNTLFDYRRKDLTVPTELQNIQGPIVGYEGSLCAFRLDLELIRFLAENRPEWQFVFVGPIDAECENSGISDFSNVHFVGRKYLADLPNYMNCFDVCINPQLINEHTSGNNPRKIMEYLAMGKPVVATRTQAMEKFGDICLLSDNQVDFLINIETVLKDKSDNREKYRRYAQNNGWEKSMTLLWSAINNL